jgi:hypothetical protein
MGLACVQPAAQGGESVLNGVMTAHEAKGLQRPDLLAELYAGFKWHFFGESAQAHLRFLHAHQY